MAKGGSGSRKYGRNQQDLAPVCGGARGRCPAALHR